MAVKILFGDLRDGDTTMSDHTVLWQAHRTARQALCGALETEIAETVLDDLARNDNRLTVSWSSVAHGEHSDIGGVDDLDWEIEDDSVLSVAYEDEQTSSAMIEPSIQWMLKAYTH